MTCGIYMIKNKKTGQMYIGQAFDIEKRWTRHIKSGDLRHSYIDRAINKYGCDCFNIIILEEVSKEKLNEREEYWISKYNTFLDSIHYNLTKGGDRGPSMYGDKNPMRRPEVALKISKIRTGSKLSKKTKEKISNSKKEKYIWQDKKHPMLGKQHTIETRKKISKSTNTSGYYRVSKVKDKKCKQGFTWVYQYHGNSIRNVDLKRLKKNVKEKGLPWFKFEEGC